VEAAMLAALASSWAITCAYKSSRPLCRFSLSASTTRTSMDESRPGDCGGLEVGKT
jgi:hypothetical protein